MNPQDNTVEAFLNYLEREVGEIERTLKGAADTLRQVEAVRNLLEEHKETVAALSGLGQRVQELEQAQQALLQRVEDELAVQWERFSREMQQRLQELQHQTEAWHAELHEALSALDMTLRGEMNFKTQLLELRIQQEAEAWAKEREELEHRLASTEKNLRWQGYALIGLGLVVFLLASLVASGML